MTSRDFCYWLQGFLELRPDKTIPLNQWQTEAIQKHLAMAFKHEIDPSYGGPDKQDPLNHLHNNNGPGGPLIRC